MHSPKFVDFLKHMQISPIIDTIAPLCVPSLLGKEILGCELVVQVGIATAIRQQRLVDLLHRGERERVRKVY